MSRQIILDTETTGLDPRTGDRIVEIGCVELLGRKPSGQRFHVYLNPGRPVADSERIHGLSDDFLADKPKFAAIVDEFSDFVRDAELIIHNAAFDIGFLNAEFALLQREAFSQLCPDVIDTLKMAREIRPGRKNNLDALCKEFGVDNSGRQVHGALLDAELLAEVYLAMTRGQNSLEMNFNQGASATDPSTHTPATLPPKGTLKVLQASAEELAAHHALLAAIAKESKGKCLWQAIDATALAATSAVSPAPSVQTP